MSINYSHDFFIQWHLTERCNLRCTHCYQEDRRREEMSLTEIQHVVDEIAEMMRDWKEAYGINFSTSFNITGGEAFLREDIFDILDAIVTRGFDIYVLSNGTLITKERSSILASLEVKGVQVSMEGPEEIHDVIRGRGSFASALRGIRNLLEAQVKVSLNTTLSCINAGHFMGMVDLAASLGVQRLGFSRLVPSGRGVVLLDKMLEKEAVKNLYSEILSLRPAGLEIVTGDPVASQLASSVHEDAGVIPSGGCAAGVSGITILADGTLTPCRRLNIPIGNIRRDSLREVWAMSEVLGLLRNKASYKGKCATCKNWALCRGCRAIAYAYALAKGQGDFLAEDPQCFIGE